MTGRSPSGSEPVEFEREVYCAAGPICPIIPPMFELLIIAVVLLVVFGASKVRGAGSDLGAAVKGFRKAVQAPQPPRPAADAGAKPDSSASTPEAVPDAEFPEVLAARARGSSKPRA